MHSYSDIHPTSTAHSVHLYKSRSV